MLGICLLIIVLLLVINDWAIRLHNKSLREEIRNEELASGFNKPGIPETVIYHHEDGSISRGVYYNDTYIDLGKQMVYPTIDESLLDEKVDTDSTWDMSLTPEVLDTRKDK